MSEYTFHPRYYILRGPLETKDFFFFFEAKLSVEEIGQDEKNPLYENCLKPLNMLS